MTISLRLLANGSNAAGNVSVVPHWQASTSPVASVDFSGPLNFPAALADAGIADPIAVPGAQD